MRYTAYYFTLLLLVALPLGALAQDAPKADSPTVAEPAAPKPNKKDNSGYFALDGSARRKVLIKRLTGWQAVYETVPGTLIGQSLNFPKQWGRGFDGLGRRFGNQYGQFASSEVIEFGVAAWREEDPRYHRRGSGGFGGRLGHSMAATFVTKDAAGNKTVAGGRLMGIYGSWALATVAWLPDEQRNPRRYAINSSLSVLTKTGANVFREFWPDVSQKLFSKKKQPVAAPSPAKSTTP